MSISQRDVLCKNCIEWIVHEENTLQNNTKTVFFIVAPCLLLRFLLFQLMHTFIHFKNTNSH